MKGQAEQQQFVKILGYESLNKRLQFVSLFTDTKTFKELLDESLSLEDFEQLIHQVKDVLLKKSLSFTDLCKVLRALGADILKASLEVIMQTSDNNLPLIAAILQYTDNFNYSIMSYLTSKKDQQIEWQGKAELECLFRLVEAQPYLLQVWNLSSLFRQTLEGLDTQTVFLLQYLRHLSVPDNRALAQEVDRLKSIELLEYLDTLRLNKAQESLKATSFDKLFDGPYQIEQHQSNSHDEQIQGKVMTSYLKERIVQVRDTMEKELFGHFSICGEEGSGKMSFIELLQGAFFHKGEEKKSQQLIVVTLEETFDSKNLVGTYVCNESGEFVFKKGPLTVAAEEGLWLILRHIEKAPSDLLSFLLPLVQENVLQVTANFSIVPKLGFRIFTLCHQQTTRVTDDIKPFLNHLHPVHLDKLMDLSNQEVIQRPDFETEILPSLYPMTFAIKWLPTILLDSVREYLHPRMNQLKAQMLDFKPLSVRQVFKMFSRVEAFLQVHYKMEELNEEFYLATNASMHIVEDIIDVYMGYLYDRDMKTKVIQELVSQVWNNESTKAMLDPQVVSDYVTVQGRNFGVNDNLCYFGRSQNMKVEKPKESDADMDDEDQAPIRKFVYTATTLRLMEQIAQGITHSEATLLVGETGTGKTTSVQELAKILGKELHVFNMNQNTDSSDLLGGFKPVDLKFLLRPLYERFLTLFKAEFKSIEKNKKFLDLTQKCYEENCVKEFLQCLNHGVTAVKGKKSFMINEAMEELENLICEVQKRANKLESGGGFIFQFIEGTLIKSIVNGEWILLDEINLASESVLNRLATLIEGNYILLNERADIVDTKRHKDFRLFFCMNPPYTSAGKKQLPWSLRSKLTEIYVPELDNQNDLWMIIDRNCSPQIIEPLKRKVLEFYISVRDQVAKQTKRGNIGLRNLSRALAFMKSAIKLKYPILKAIYDSLYTCFASHLDANLQIYISALIFKLFSIKQMPQLAHTQEQQLSDKYALVEQFIIHKGKHPVENFNERDFVTTASFKKLLRQLAGVVAVSDYAVILQGPTSAGKTSTVQYLANITHNKVIRINNHMHTDIQEYLGSYVPDKEGGGKLIFQEGVLVEAVRNGYWVILDELNLAPSEVLEALNRLLDDNRELLIVETQKVIKAHPNFRIFATQNPTEGYGGRKELSEAFKNRFILINVHDVPLDELVEILIHKCELPKSRADVMVKVMEQLQIYRSQGSNLFSGKDSTITVRDLLKWASRLTEQAQTSTSTELALEGFMVLAERSRSDQDKKFIKTTIETVTKVKIDEKAYYENYFEKHLAKQFAEIPSQLNLPRLIQSQQLKRLAVLVHKCLLNKEPVLLVGETGCGKTTLCQVFAVLGQQELFAINCHQNTETSDFIGCMRTRKNVKQTQDKFIQDYRQLLTLLSTKGLLNDPTLQINDSPSIKQLRTKLSNLIKAVKLVNLDDDIKSKIDALKTLRDDLSCIFEWHDGILVEAMQEGGLLLIDEISLANDSVLERLNSVFEADRTLVISEKSSKEAVRIVGHQNFKMVATMNPSGDFGKKELSPALRNRMTEIWVESYFHQGELIELYKSVNLKQSSSDLATVFEEVNHSVDLYLIIEQTALDKLKIKVPNTQAIKKVALGIFNLIGFVNFVMSQKYFVLQRKSLSIRDILSMIDFIQVTIDNVFNNDLCLAFRHAVSLVILDGLCLGIDVSGERQKNEIFKMCSEYLTKTENQLFGEQIVSSQMEQYIENDSVIGVNPFHLAKLSKSIINDNSYAFDAQTTKLNLLKLLRAYQLNKPILIEGPPGVGKTSIVENLAKVTGRKLVRVNLSEQTDMMDLLGSEYPVSIKNAKGPESADDDDDIRFHWCDGVLLQAIKEGHWFLIDEMNLAQQSVLEGLNAILDHRRTVYIPELNQEFKCHPDFFVFACQNPSQSATSVGGRKTLPKSFLNRFNKIFLEELTQDDYSCIIQRQVSIRKIQDLNVEKLLTLSHKIELLIKEDARNQSYQDEGAVNMRDLSRFLNLYRSFIENDAADSSQSLYHAFRICYLQRLSVKKQQEAIDLLNSSGLLQVLQDVSGLSKAQIIRVDEKTSTLTFLNPIKVTRLNLDPHSSLRVQAFSTNDYLNLKGMHSTQLQFLVDCLNCNLPLLVVTNQPQRLIENMQTMAKITGQKLNRILLNDRSDTAQLLGCFEQTASDFSTFVKELDRVKAQANDPQIVARINELEHTLKASNQAEQLELARDFVESITMLDCHSVLEGRLEEAEHAQRKGGSSKFEWVDSVLVKSIVEGEWAVFENANLCNPSILDRLNPLLEEGNNSLCINEQGLVDGDLLRNIQAHDAFRSIFVISSHSLIDQGKDVSRALRNRCLQVSITYENESNNQESQQVIDTRLMQIQWDVEVMKDYQSLKTVQETITEVNGLFTGLGKRTQRDQIDNQTLSTVMSYEHTQLSKFFEQECVNSKRFSKAYIHYLVQLLGREHAEILVNYILPRYPAFKQQLAFIQEHPALSGKPWLAHTLLRILSAKNLISKQLAQRTLLMNKNSHQFLTFLIAQVQALSSGPHDRELLTLLRDIKECLRCKDYNAISSYRNIYLMMIAMKGQGMDDQLKKAIENGIGSKDGIVGVMIRRLQEESKISLEDVAKYGPNTVQAVTIAQMKKVQQQLQEIKQQPFQVCIKSMTENLEIRVGLQSLINSFVILMLDDDKAIKRITPETMKQLLDPYLLQERLRTAYTILVPANPLKPDIIMTATELYPHLCMIKDLIKLQRGADMTNLPFKRLSSVSPQVSAFTPHSAQMHLLRAITLDTLETSYAHDQSTLSIEKRLIDSVLDAAGRARMRELPGYFLCSTSLQKSIKKYLTLLETQSTTPMSLRAVLLNGGLPKSLVEYVKEQVSTPSDQLLQQCKEHPQIIENMSDALTLVPILGASLLDCLESLFMIPLETHRLSRLLDLEEQHLSVHKAFLSYHLQIAEHDNLSRSKIEGLQNEMNQIAKLKPPTTESENVLRVLLGTLTELHQVMLSLIAPVTQLKKEHGIDKKLALATQMISRLTTGGQEFLHFNNFLTAYLLSAQTLIACLRPLLENRNLQKASLIEAIFAGSSVNKTSLQWIEPIKLMKSDPKYEKLYEQYLKYMLKSSKEDKLLRSVCLDHFVHREFARKLKEEQDQETLEELVYRLPFKMKVQTLMEDNKAYGDRTKEDKEKMEKEANKEIEKIFPSYFDEFQRIIFAGPSADMDAAPEKEKAASDVKVESIMQQLIASQADPKLGKQERSLAKRRLKMLQELYSVTETKQQEVEQTLSERSILQSDWLVEISNHLREELHHSSIPSVMNVSEVRLTPEFNFYHDPLPQESRLVYEPLSALITRLDRIIVDYNQQENPILQDSIFLANYMLVTFAPKEAPLMKILTGLELVLNKLEEWEVYASKSLNSCFNEMNLMKQLIIRYRKIQILSWRNLLQWRKTQLVREDIRENFVRLAHTLERQVFDRQYYRVQNKKEISIELKVMEVLDLFLRDSSLGQFQGRLAFVGLLLSHFKQKQSQIQTGKASTLDINLLEGITNKVTIEMKERLTRVVNIISFVHAYYNQFSPKLTSTLARLDLAAREKVKVLIDVSKWTVQKFAQVKNNIDKRHRQLTKACKQEEEALIQNVAYLVLTSSRKKYVQRDEGLAGLHAEKELLSEKTDILESETPVKFVRMNPSQFIVIQQMGVLERRKFENKWPECMSVEFTIEMMFDRLKIVRDINKKHIQRRAFIDLQKYLKEQGLQHNFQSSLQPMLLETQLVTFKNSPNFTNPLITGQEFKRYYLKSHELLMMLENASEAENATNAHLRNIEIIRVRGFSQSLILKVLQLNQVLRKVKNHYKGMFNLEKETNAFLVIPSSEENIDMTLQPQMTYSSKQSKKYSEIAEQFIIVQKNMNQQLNMLNLTDQSKLEVPQVQQSFNKTIAEEHEVQKLLDCIRELIQWCKTTNISNLRQSKLVQQDYLPQCQSLESQLLELFKNESSDSNTEDLNKLSKKVNTLQKRSQLFIQDLHKVQEQLYEAERKRRDSLSIMDDGSVTLDNTLQDATPERIDLTIKEQHEFSENLVKECFDKHLPLIQKVTSSIFTFKGQENVPSNNQNVRQALSLAAQLVNKVTGMIKFVMENMYLYLRSLAKFSFITQRIFIYLIFEGFCGEDDKQDDDENKQNEEDDKFFDNDGMGMGDGKGGQQNVSNQIEDEEQVEGLKNYESEEEKPPEEKNDEDKKDEEDDNDFEMKDGDFDGELEDKPDKEDGEEEDKKSQEDEDDDALDDVDDMLDNKLWNENMQDMEDREQEEDEKPEDKPKKDDVDLGERDLDEENQVPQKPEEKELTAGDHDKQEDDAASQKNDDNEQDDQMAEEQNEKDDEEMPEEDEEKGEEQEGDDPNQIPLDRDPNVMEDVKEEEQDEEGSEDDKGNDEQSFSDDNPDSKSEEVDSEYSDQHNDKDADNDDLNSQNSEVNESENEDYKRDGDNKDILEENDQIQDQEKDNEHQQSNLRKPKESNLNQEQKSKQNQAQQQNMEENTQFDVQGSDILFQLSNKLKQQPTPQQPKQQDSSKQESKKEEMREIERPQMNDNQALDKQAQPNKEEEQVDDDQEAMEYELYQDQAEQMQGRLATDKVEQQQIETVKEDQDEVMQEAEEDEDITQKKTESKTETEAKQVKATDVKQDKGGEEESKEKREGDQEMMEAATDDEKAVRDLIDDYQEYLNQRKLMELSLENERGQDEKSLETVYFTQQLERFDYGLSRQRIRELFSDWQSNPDIVSQAQSLLSRFKQETSTSAASLCEQLRIVLEPQLSQQLMGDYKTGKRLNMKKVISFIASHYRNDKIWLRRTMPSKRDYRILVAIDDSLSMREGGLGFFSLEALTTITEALHRLEVGKVAVAAIRDRMELLQTFEEGAQQSNERNAFVLSQFGFEHNAPKSSDYAMANFVRDANQMFDSQNLGGDVMNLPFVIVLSDGRFTKHNVRPYLNEAREKRYLYIFVILDSVKETPAQDESIPKSARPPKKSDGSILSMRSVEKDPEDRVKLVPYLKDFPFEYYCIVRDVHQLPQALGNILVQWFSLINNGGANTTQ